MNSKECLELAQQGTGRVVTASFRVMIYVPDVTIEPGRMGELGAEAIRSALEAGILDRNVADIYTLDGYDITCVGNHDIQYEVIVEDEVPNIEETTIALPGIGD